MSVPIYAHAMTTFGGFCDIDAVDGHVHFEHVNHADGLLDFMQAVKVSRVNLVSIPDPMTLNHNAALIGFKARFPDRAYICGGPDYTEVVATRPRDPAILASQVNTLRAIGFDGWKLLAGKPRTRRWLPIPLDASPYEGMWTALEEHQMPVVWHVADPEEFWDEERCPVWARLQGCFYGGGDYPPKEQFYQEVDAVLGRHPRLRIILAHFYFLSADLGRAAAFLDAHPTVCFDLAPGNEMFINFARNHEATRAFFQRYADRLIFGTDISANRVAAGPGGRTSMLDTAWLVRSFLETDGPLPLPSRTSRWLDPHGEGLCGLGLPHASLERICRTNFERWFGPAPRALDLESAGAELRRMAAAMQRRATMRAAASEALEMAQRLTGATDQTSGPRA